MNRQGLFKNLPSILLVLNLILIEQVGAKENARTMGSKLFLSSNTWQPFGNNSSGTYYFYPESVINNGYKWEISITYVNNVGQYIPDNTRTYEIDCLNGEIQSLGWRINTYLYTHKEIEGWLSQASNKIPVQTGTLGSIIKDWVCGLNIQGADYYGMYGYKNEHGESNNFTNVWLKNNEIFISKEDNDVRMANLWMFVSHPKPTASYFSYYLRCSNSTYFDSTTNSWLVFDNKMFERALLGRACRDQSNVKKYIKEFSLPIATLVSSTQQISDSLDKSIEDAKRKCADLGFVAGTTKFGQCVLKISK